MHMGVITFAAGLGDILQTGFGQYRQQFADLGEAILGTILDIHIGIDRL